MSFIITAVLSYSKMIAAIRRKQAAIEWLRSRREAYLRALAGAVLQDWLLFARAGRRVLALRAPSQGHRQVWWVIHRWEEGALTDAAIFWYEDSLLIWVLDLWCIEAQASLSPAADAGPSWIEGLMCSCFFSCSPPSYCFPLFLLSLFVVW